MKMINVRFRKDAKTGKRELLEITDETGAAISFDRILPASENSEVMQLEIRVEKAE